MKTTTTLNLIRKESAYHSTIAIYEKDNSLVINSKTKYNDYTFVSESVEKGEIEFFIKIINKSKDGNSLVKIVKGMLETGFIKQVASVTA